MNVASRVLLGVAVDYSVWADREMAGWKLLVGTAALQDCSSEALQCCSALLTPSSTRSIVTSVNSCQLKRNITVHNGTADPSSAVLWLWAVVPFVILPMCVDWDRVNRG